MNIYRVGKRSRGESYLDTNHMSDIVYSSCLLQYVLLMQHSYSILAELNEIHTYMNASIYLDYLTVGNTRACNPFLITYPTLPSFMEGYSLQQKDMKSRHARTQTGCPPYIPGTTNLLSSTCSFPPWLCPPKLGYREKHLNQRIRYCAWTVDW